MKTSPRLICISTHHKTGTLWMRKVWKDIAAEQEIPFTQCNTADKLRQLPETGTMILVNWSGRFPKALFERDDAVFLHMIRDPRDVLLSGARYHQIARTVKEKFLLETRPEWGGRTYQDMINALPDEESRLRFEMHGKHAITVQEMLAWPWGHPDAVELRYEEMIEDRDCARFRELLETWAIPGVSIEKALVSYWNNSLFGEAKSSGASEGRWAAHVGSGKKTQWSERFTRKFAREYARSFGPALRALNYAEDDAWVTECGPSKASDQTAA